MKTIINIGLGVVAIFILFILKKKNKQNHDYILLAINILLGTILLSDIWVKNDLTKVSLFINFTSPFWVYSFIMLYTFMLIDTHKNIKKRLPIVFSISTLFTIFLVFDLYFLNIAIKNVLQDRFLAPPLSYHFFFKGNNVFVVLSGFWLLKKLSNYEYKIKANFSYIENIRLTWIKHSIVILMLINCISFFSFLVYNFGFVKSIDSIYIILNSSILLAAFYMSFNGIKQYSITSFFQFNELPKASKTTKSEPVYKSSSLKEENIIAIFNDLEVLFHKKKLFIQPQLKISEVAVVLKVSSHHLSEVINKQYGKSFYEYIAYHRVKLLKEKLIDPDNKKFTILALALDCGFNSKATLNRVFKEQTGTTPSQFQKSHLI